MNERVSVPQCQSVLGCEQKAPIMSWLVLAGIREWTGAQGSDVGNIDIECKRGQEHAGSVNYMR